MRQAKDYAQRLQCRMAYASNGHEIYQMDLCTGEESLVKRFLSPDELWQLSFDPGQQPGDKPAEPAYAAVWRQRFAQIPFEAKGDWAPRYYQENAINNALDAIARGEQRVLLTLATGTGKTCIAFQTAWKLFQSRWSLHAQHEPDKAGKRPRILFLADRNVLANQAFNDFGPFGEDALVRIEPAEIKKKGAVPKNASVFFTIFQTFMSGGEDEHGEPTPYFGDYPPDFFDFIVIDECHRGGANDESAWREILNYFAPAVQLGLTATATPKRAVNADTYVYFGEPVYSYALKDGINDGFLTPFKVLPIVGTMDEYIYTPGDGVVVRGEPERGKVCDLDPCTCEKPDTLPCTDCGQKPCVCEKKLVITLSDGKTRQIKHIASALYWSPDGTPITAREFIERLFADLPRFFGDEDQLREIWADPTTREKLLNDLAEEGYDAERLDAMNDLIDAKDSDVYDVLAYVAYSAETKTRRQRAQSARSGIASAYASSKQQEFINFILDRYVRDGVGELAPSKMRSLIELKYATISDATQQLGSPLMIRETFVGFQKYLYQPDQDAG